ncbi:MAG: hypothetical protein QOI66_868, partial [Myxococcales bacterium]|nr:hypothetical protein [Myxococcales bacterium]
MKTPVALPLMLAGTRRSAVAGAEGGFHAGRDVAATKGKPDDFASALAEATAPAPGAGARPVGDKATVGRALPPVTPPPLPLLNRKHTVFAKDATREPSEERRFRPAAAVTPKRAADTKVPNPGARQPNVIAERAKTAVAESVAPAAATRIVAGAAPTMTTPRATVGTLASVATVAERRTVAASERPAGSGVAP